MIDSRIENLPVNSAEVPAPALMLSILAHNFIKFLLQDAEFLFTAASRMMQDAQEADGCELEKGNR
jgi:hypothetical protein